MTGTNDRGDPRGWVAIDEQLAKHYRDQKPAHWGTVRRYREGGDDPLDGISAYRVDEPPHWHYATFGMTELGGKTSEDKAISGWGFEFTFRLARDPAEVTAPEWPISMLQTMARYVYNTGQPFDVGHYIEFGGPLSTTTPTKLEALVFARDPELAAFDGPNGRVSFLQAIGITADEQALLTDATVDRVLALMSEDDRLLQTRLGRDSQAKRLEQHLANR